MFQPWLFVGFVGHRKLANPVAVADAIRAAIDRIAARARAPLAAVSSAASGADTLFAEIASERALPWTLLLPFEVERFKNDFTPADWVRVERLLPRAVRVHVENAVERGDAFGDCSNRTIEESDVLIAVWDGAESRGRGGTGDSVRYARSLGKPLLWIDPTTGAIIEERLEKLGGAEATGHRVSTHAPQAHHDAAASANEPPTPLAGRESVEALFQQLTAHAKRYRPRAINLNLSLILLHQAATVIAIAALVWTEEKWLTDGSAWVKFLILVLALVLPWFLRHSHHEWMHQRIKAELCRAALALWPLPRPEQNFAGIQLPVEPALQRSLLLARLAQPPPAAPLAEIKEGYRAQRIAKQHAYFLSHSQHAARLGAWLRRLAIICTVSAIGGGALVAFHVVGHDDHAYHAVKFLSLSLPLAATAFLSSMAALDLSRRAARFGEIAQFLHEAGLRLEQAATPDGVTRVAVEVERTLLFEIWEWITVQRFAGHH